MSQGLSKKDLEKGKVENFNFNFSVMILSLQNHF